MRLLFIRKHQDEYHRDKIEKVVALHELAYQVESIGGICLLDHVV